MSYILFLLQVFLSSSASVVSFVYGTRYLKKYYFLFFAFSRASFNTIYPVYSSRQFCPSVLWRCWFDYVACKNRHQNDQLCVGWDVKPRDLRIVFFRSNRISNRIGRLISFRIESSNRIGRIYHTSGNTAWRTAGIPYKPIICWRLALWTNDSDVRNWVLVHFNSVLKRVKQCRCTLI